MGSDEEKAPLDMLGYAQEARDLAFGMSLSKLEQDRRTQLAILKCIETIGEAATRLSLEFRRSHSEVPWGEIIGMRNRLVHEYDGIDLADVWDVIIDDMSDLIMQKRH